MAKRKQVVSAETEVLKRSGRRCCICFGLHRDLKVKPGQIAHLDRNPANSGSDNLAFLCLEHHDQYDTRTSQSKGWTVQEVEFYKDELYQAIRTLRAMESDSTHFTAMTNLSEWQRQESERLASLADTISSRVDHVTKEWREFQKNMEQQTHHNASEESD